MRFARVLFAPLLLGLAGCPFLDPQPGPTATSEYGCTPSVDLDGGARAKTTLEVGNVGNDSARSFSPWTDGSSWRFLSGGQGLQMLSLAFHVGEARPQCVRITFHLLLCYDEDARFDADGGTCGTPTTRSDVTERYYIETDERGVTPTILFPAGSGHVSVLSAHVTTPTAEGDLVYETTF